MYNLIRINLYSLTCSFLAHFDSLSKNPLENKTTNTSKSIAFCYAVKSTNKFLESIDLSESEGSETDKETLEIPQQSIFLILDFVWGFYRCPCPVPSPVCGEMITTRFAGEYFSMRLLSTVVPLYLLVCVF